MASLLSQLKQMTEVVADTGDLDAIRSHKPQDATTNPSLVLKAAALPEYKTLIAESIKAAKVVNSHDWVDDACDRLAVKMGCEILQHIPGLVSTEVDARLSFDTAASYNKAKKLISLYQSEGVSKERILIKIASTWEGIQAARRLESEGVRCNLTLLFNFTQALACADAGAYLISPFVGRILDWHKQEFPNSDFAGIKDPGVMSVSKIYNYYKEFAIDTVVMGASFRTSDEIICLAGCDKLTISPALLSELGDADGDLVRQLVPSQSSSQDECVMPNESSFRWALNEDPMATLKLAEGIRNFAVDQRALVKLLENFDA